MKGMVPPDPHGNASSECFAVVYVPRRSRNRFPSASVHIVSDAQAAIDQSDPSNKRYPAVVHGPSKSSEGQMIYYLVNWLE
jgi:hypothetical protein